MRRTAPWTAFVLSLAVGLASIPGTAMAQTIPQDSAALDEAYISQKEFEETYAIAETSGRLSEAS